MKDRGPWMQTRYGRVFYPHSPSPEEVFIDDIASHLSKLCRFTGAVSQFYSVAQHSVFVSRLVSDHLAFQGLMHDSAEAYLNDIGRPVKEKLLSYQCLEGIIWATIAAKFGGLPLNFDAIDKEVVLADKIMLMTERRDLLLPPPMPWEHVNIVPMTGKIIPLAPEDAERQFLARFKEVYREQA